jgi:selenocysteine lyase/cysteine desulfurase
MAPEKLETGTQSHEGMVGSAAAVNYLASLAPGAEGRRAALGAVFGELHHRGQALFGRLWDGLGAIPGVTRFGPGLDRPRTTTVAFTVAGRTAEAVARHLAERGLFLSHGNFYAASVIEKLGVEALVRAGITCYTSEGEIDRLIEGVAELP